MLNELSFEPLTNKKQRIDCRYELHFHPAEAISDLRQQLKRRRHGRDDEDDEDAESERSASGSGDSGSGDNDLEAAVVAVTAADTAPGESTIVGPCHD